MANARVRGLRGLMRPTLVSAVFLMLVAGLGYPLVLTAVAQVILPGQAGGSLVLRDGQVVGSGVVGQAFTSRGYLHPRPSKTAGMPYNASASGASNLGPTNRVLIDTVAHRVAAYRTENRLLPAARVPVDAVTASASGLDPDISIANANLQAARIAAYRGIPERQVRRLVADNAAPRALGLFGEPRVNVLRLNLALDAALPR